MLSESVTALASPQSPSTSPYKLAVGLETGCVHLYSWESQFKLIKVFNVEAAHHLTVTRLQFCPTDPGLLASCSQDHAVKIYNLSDL